DLDIAAAAVGIPAALERQAVTFGLAAIAVIERAKTIDKAAVDGALWNLIGGRPARTVGHACNAEPTAGRVDLRVTQHGIAALQILRLLPGTIVARKVYAEQQRAVARRHRI